MFITAQTYLFACMDLDYLDACGWWDLTIPEDEALARVFGA